MKTFIKLNPTNNNIEKYIIDCIKKQKHSIDFFSLVDDKFCDVIYKGIKNKFNIILKHQCQLINSIKSAFVKSIIISNNHRLIENRKKIKDIYINNEKNFNNKINYENPVKYISETYTLSPLNIMRFIIKTKYSQKLTKINKKKLSKFDNKMIDYSIECDKYALIDGSKIMKDALQFEKDIEKILIKLKIKFKTQDELAEEQIKEFGKAINTPDFLILSEFYVNKIKINWIDAKKFYGSNINFVKTKIEQQTKKYISEYGTGAIIFNLGFNENLNFGEIILIDYNSFEKELG
jgi:hypothetical protein